MLAIVDYGMGNIRSVQAALKHLGKDDYYLAAQPDELLKADIIILPGVGAYGAASDALHNSGMADALKQRAAAGVPLLGICLGMQILFDKGIEFGEHDGLGLLPGIIRRFDTDMKVPHMGWNNIELMNNCPLFTNLPDEVYAYFAHSYMADSADAPHAAGVTEYGERFVSIAWKNNVFGTQFHPEKSGRHGLLILKNFLEVN